MDSMLPEQDFSFGCCAPHVQHHLRKRNIADIESSIVDTVEQNNNNDNSSSSEDSRTLALYYHLRNNQTTNILQITKNDMVQERQDLYAKGV